MNINIIPLDIDNKEHIDFTYEVLKQRSYDTRCNIVPFSLPTYDQHADNLRKFSYKCYYILTYRGIMYGVEYVDNNYKYAVHYVKRVIKEIVKKYKNDPEIKRKGYREILNLLLERHPEIKKLTAEININNSVSYESAKRLGFKPSYYVLTYTR